MLKRLEQKNKEFYENTGDFNSDTDSEDSEMSQEIVMKRKVLAVTSRGVNHRQRHLFQDISNLIPHMKKDAKFDGKKNLQALNELAELNDCNHCFYLEARKDDLYLWLAATPLGNSWKFLVHNVHTLDELNLPGNCMRGTRAILSFDESFDKSETLQSMREMLTMIFQAPATSRNVKPYHDHVFTFSVVDGRVWFRNWEIKEETVDNEVKMNLLEIGPRFVLQPILQLEGAFRGQVKWKNEDYLSPNVIRSTQRKQQTDETEYKRRTAEKRIREEKDFSLIKTDLDRVFDNK